MPGVVLFRWAAGVLGIVLFASSAWAQLDDVILRVDREHIGLGGRVRPGSWTPLLLTVENRSSADRLVFCRWLLQDADGDTVVAQRRVNLNPQRKEFVWLYGTPPLTTRPGTRWLVQVVDAQENKILASQTLDIIDNNLISPRTSAIGVFSNAGLGLEPYTTQDTHHEKTAPLRGLSLTTLPDRWFGLSVLSAMIWTADGGDPNDALVTPEMQQAVRDWVRRGGHLVIFIPAINEPWTGSALADLLPVTEQQMRRVEDVPPHDVAGVPKPEAAEVKVNMTVFDVEPHNDVAVLARDKATNPLIVSGRYGFGNVTLIGLDLSDRRLFRLGYPGAGRFRIWNEVFDWQGPIDSQAVIKLEIDNQQRNHPDNRNPVSLTDFIDGRIAQSGTAAVGLLAAILVFGLYWLLAGPVCFFMLKQRKAMRFSWLTFTAVVGLFTVVAWGGAYLMQPVRMNATHFSIVDVDAKTGTAHAHSWLSLYVPRFGKVNVAVDAEQPNNLNTLASPGVRTGLEEAGFLDPQTYVLDCAAPNSAEVPFRATTKQFEIDYLGPTRDDNGASWTAITGEVKLNAMYLPEGSLSHGLPGPLHDVVMIYCRGNDEIPLVYRHRDSQGKIVPWDPGQALEMPRGWPDRLVLRARENWTDRKLRSEGFLGVASNNVKGRSADDMTPGVSLPADKIKSRIEMLTFYETLPPPDFRNVKMQYPGPAAYQRELGRPLDLTRLTAGRRLIVMGHLHLKKSTLPVPLTVDGDSPPADGWTVVRWIYDFD